MIVKNRVKKHSEFKQIIESGKQEKSNSLSMYYLSNTLNYCRVGISVSKKSGNAVVRNKIKRQIRAICAKTVDFTKSFDIIFIVRKGYVIDDFDKTKQDLMQLLSKIGKQQ